METAEVSVSASETLPLDTSALETVLDLSAAEAATLYTLGELVAAEAAAGLQESLGQPAAVRDPTIGKVDLHELEGDAWSDYLVVDLRLELAPGNAYSSVLLLPQADIQALLPSAEGDGPNLEALSGLVHGLMDHLTERLAGQFEPELRLAVAEAELTEDFGESDGSLVKIEHELAIGEHSFAVAHLLPPSALRALAAGTLPQQVPSEAPPPAPAAVSAATQTPPVGGTAVHPAAFAPLEPEGEAQSATNLDLLLGVPLRVTVELGRRQMTIREVLALGPGSVVELNRIAGEPVDILVNNQFIARGEVVVVDENFGVRVTEIVSPARRLTPRGREG